MDPRIEAIYTAPAEALPVTRRSRVRATPGAGLDGDRYALGTGYWSADHKVSRDVTLIEAETVEALAVGLGTALDGGVLRRNVVTRGVRLDDLVGARFRIGDVVVEGTGLCEPCVHLERVVGRPILRPLVHRGGLRANILTPGEIVEGDPILLDVPNVGVGVLVRREGRYLLGRRRSERGDGTWSTPGGSVAAGESVLACAIRELAEETGVRADRPRVVASANDRLDDGAEWRSVFVAVDVDTDAEPRLLEPDKCAEWAWFEPTALPDPMFAPVATILA
jgi:ADP-ribose pyrophosphatase YjhB (NUDIX family)